MGKVRELEEKVFFETKNILANLAEISTLDELLSKQDLFEEAADRLSFLRVLGKNREALENAVFETESPHDSDTLNVGLQENTLNTSEDTGLPEEVQYTTEINEIDPPVEVTSPVEIVADILEETFEVASPTQNFDADTTEHESALSPDEDYQSRVRAKEKELQEVEEKRRRIVEFSKKGMAAETAVDISTSPENAPVGEKKFKLANIKGLKSMQNLFGEDPLEETKQEQVSGTLHRSNMPTDFMEAPRSRAAFKIDLNDKVAFTKLLFRGNETELKETVEKLNSFATLDEARQYLSDLYYDKKWEKVDEYAQRLWTLVESKFQ